MFFKKLFVISFFAIIFILMSAIPSMSADDDSILVIFSSTEGGGATGDFIQNQNEEIQTGNFRIDGRGEANFLRATPNAPAPSTPQAGDIRTILSGTDYAIYTYDGTCWRKLNPWDGTTCYGSPLIVNAGSNVGICSGGNTNLTAIASGGIPPYNYDWSNDGLGEWGDPATISVSPGSTSEYTVYVRDAELTESDPDAVIVTIINPPSSPTEGTHTPSSTQIIWNWNVASGATSYKWNTSDSYGTAIDMGTNTSKTETGLTSGTEYTRYVWAYNTCGHSFTTTLTETTTIIFSATGGTITEGGGFRTHTFTTSGTFTPNTTGNVEILVVAGGGSGGCSNGSGGGGGAGGLIYISSYTVTAQVYTVTVGSGGAQATISNTSNSGQNSVFGSLTAIGGGGGGFSGGPGLSGGSGGGGTYGQALGGTGTQPAQSGDSGTYGFGTNGGQGAPQSGAHGGGGGGGAGQVGTAGTTSTGGKGGDGKTYFSATYAGGGGGGVQVNTYTPGAGGAGGGGTGGSSPSLPGVAGTTNTGGGGGGGYQNGYPGGAGGSGIVIVRYPI